MTHNLICIVCPKGCPLQAEQKGEELVVTGNTCKRGEDYAKSELLHPTRTLTTILRVKNRENTFVSVKTKNPIPKEKLQEAVTLLRSHALLAPLAVGDVAVEDLFGSPVIITKEVK